MRVEFSDGYEKHLIPLPSGKSVTVYVYLKYTPVQTCVYESSIPITDLDAMAQGLRQIVASLMHPEGIVSAVN